MARRPRWRSGGAGPLDLPARARACVRVWSETESACVLRVCVCVTSERECERVSKLVARREPRFYCRAGKHRSAVVAALFASWARWAFGVVHEVHMFYTSSVDWARAAALAKRRWM